MKKKKYFEILKHADNDTIEKIENKYPLLDENKTDKILKMSLKKMNEMKTQEQNNKKEDLKIEGVEKYTKRPIWQRITGIAAAAAIVACGAALYKNKTDFDKPLTSDVSSNSNIEEIPTTFSPTEEAVKIFEKYEDFVNVFLIHDKVDTNEVVEICNCKFYKFKDERFKNIKNLRDYAETIFDPIYFENNYYIIGKNFYSDSLIPEYDPSYNINDVFEFNGRIPVFINYNDELYSYYYSFENDSFNSEDSLLNLVLDDYITSFEWVDYEADIEIIDDNLYILTNEYIIERNEKVLKEKIKLTVKENGNGEWLIHDVYTEVINEEESQIVPFGDFSKINYLIPYMEPENKKDIHLKDNTVFETFSKGYDITNDRREELSKFFNSCTWEPYVNEENNDSSQNQITDSENSDDNICFFSDIYGNVTIIEISKTGILTYKYFKYEYQNDGKLICIDESGSPGNINYKQYKIDWELFSSTIENILYGNEEELNYISIATYMLYGYEELLNLFTYGTSYDSNDVIQFNIIPSKNEMEYIPDDDAYLQQIEKYKLMNYGKYCRNNNDNFHNTDDLENYAKTIVSDRLFDELFKHNLGDSMSEYLPGDTVESDKLSLFIMHNDQLYVHTYKPSIGNMFDHWIDDSIKISDITENSFVAEIKWSDTPEDSESFNNKLDLLKDAPSNKYLFIKDSDSGQWRLDKQLF